MAVHTFCHLATFLLFFTQSLIKNHASRFVLQCQVCKICQKSHFIHMYVCCDLPKMLRPQKYVIFTRVCTWWICTDRETFIYKAVTQPNQISCQKLWTIQKNCALYIMYAFMNYISECTVFILIVKAHHSYDLYHMSEAFSKVDFTSVWFF